MTTAVGGQGEKKKKTYSTKSTYIPLDPQRHSRAVAFIHTARNIPWYLKQWIPTSSERMHTPMMYGTVMIMIISSAGYDGGDCCECTCADTEEYTCGDNGEFDCVDPRSLCAHVEVGTKTSVTVSANAYDTRGNSAGIGCGASGCEPALARDGDGEGAESRWSCAQKIVPDGSLCEITFTFGEPQDIKGSQIAFLNGDDRTRSVEVRAGCIPGTWWAYPRHEYGRPVPSSIRKRGRR